MTAAPTAARRARRHGAAVTFAASDLRSWWRDPLLRALLLAPPGLVAVLAGGIPLVEGWLASAHDLDLSPHRPVVVALLTAVVMPLLFGMVAGLLLLEDRESGVLRALTVTPVRPSTYVAVRCAGAGALAATAVTVALATVPAAGVDLAGALAVGWLSGGTAAASALLFGALADDRLEGVAVAKAMTLPAAAALLAWVLTGWAELPLALLPTYTPVITLWDATDGSLRWWVVAGGTAQLTAWYLVLRWAFLRRLHACGT